MKRNWFYLGDRKTDYLSLLSECCAVKLEGKSIDIGRAVLAEQVHGDHIHICTESDSGAGFEGCEKIAGADGLITAIPNQYLMIRTADCYPVLIFDPECKAIAALHSGREGTRLNITGKAINILKDEFGCDPAKLCAYIGAGVCEDHYEVSEDIYESFINDISAQGFAHRAPHRSLNLRMVVFQQLIKCGITFKNIENIQECSYENQAYFSYRRDKGNNRQINIIGIIDE